MAYEKLQQRLLDFLQEHDGAASNRVLRESLGCTDGTYERVKDALVAAEKIERWRGPGGTVRFLKKGNARSLELRPASSKPKPRLVEPRAAGKAASATVRPAGTIATNRRRVDTYRYEDETRKNIPTAEFQSIAQQMEATAPLESTRYERRTRLAKGETRERNADLDPQIVWRGVRITLTQTQRKQLQVTGEVELGDAQLVWRGKDTQDWSDLVVNPPPIYIQEKIHPKAIIEGIREESRARRVDDGWA
jgi:hypothetical protein